MIGMNGNFQELKEELYEVCKKKQIPTNNKGSLLYYSAFKLKENPEDEELRQLLLLALADYGVLLAHFPEGYAGDMEGRYQELKERYGKLAEDYRHYKILAEKWEDIQMSYDRLPKVDIRYETDRSIFKEETNRAVYLYRKFMEVSERESPELYNNLHRFICITKQEEKYRQITPLFLCWVMIRHKDRLASKENLNISLKSLWTYKEYKIERNNAKNYKKYKKYKKHFKLFRKLCKMYREDSSVDLELCRYGFCAISNLSDWIAEMQFKKVGKVLTAFSCDLAEADMSCIEIGETEAYSARGIFGIAWKDEVRYMEEFQDDYEQVEQAVTEYVMEHIEYLVHWMKYLYVDIPSLRGHVDEIYRECIPKLPEEKAWMEGCIRAHIYETIQELLDRGVRSAVVSALTPRKESKNSKENKEGKENGEGEENKESEE